MRGSPCRTVLPVRLPAWTAVRRPARHRHRGHQGHFALRKGNVSEDSFGYSPFTFIAGDSQRDGFRRRYLGTSLRPRMRTLHHRGAPLRHRHGLPSKARRCCGKDSIISGKRPGHRLSSGHHAAGLHFPKAQPHHRRPVQRHHPCGIESQGRRSHHLPAGARLRKGGIRSPGTHRRPQVGRVQRVDPGKDS